MAIIGITNDKDGRVIQRLSVVTKLAIGLPPEGERKHPQKLDHFVFLRKPSDSQQGNRWEIDPDLTKHYAGREREVEIIMLDDDLENVFPTRMAWFTASQLVCHGNGENATRRTEKHPEGEPWRPCGSTCVDLQAGRCKPSGDLRFMLADFPRLGAIARIHTSSYRSIQQIHSSLQQVQIITGGRLAGIRAHLCVRPEKTSYEAKGLRHSTTIWALSLEMRSDGIKKLVDRMTETARLFEQTRKMLGGGGHVEIDDAEEEEFSEEIAGEFYPQSSETKAANPETTAADPETIPPITATGVAEDMRKQGLRVTPASALPAPAVAVPSALISMEERTALYKQASGANVTHADLLQYLSEQHNITSMTKITRKAFEECREWLKAVK
jgi:hypothetical protein